MAMGMTYDEFWHGNYAKLEYYRKAYEAKRETANYDAWLQGAYVYDALCMVSPILHAFAKSGAKPVPYHKKPYGKQSEYEDAAEKKAIKTNKEQQEIHAINASAKFASFMTKWNKRFDGEGGGLNGNND